MNNIFDIAGTIIPDLIKRINKDYKLSNDAIIDLNKKMEYYDQLKADYEKEYNSLTSLEKDIYQIKYNYNSNQTKYSICLMQKNATYKAYHSNRMKMVENLIKIKLEGDKEQYKIKIFEYIDKLIEEKITELNISSELAKTTPHFHRSCLEYCNLFYKSVMTEKIRMEFQPELDKIKEDYNNEKIKIEDSTNILSGKTSEQKEEIIKRKKELVDKKYSFQLLEVEKNLDKKIEEKNRYKKIEEKNRHKKSAISYDDAMSIINEMDEFFFKIKKEGLLLDIEQQDAKKFEKMEKEFVELRDWIIKLNLKELEKQSDRAIELKDETLYYKKYQIIEEEKNHDNKITFQRNQILKIKTYNDILSKKITMEKLAEEDPTKILDDLLLNAGLEKEKESKTESKKASIS